MSAMTKAYDEGYAAYSNGIRRADNPYLGPDAELWDEGWCDAEEDASKEAMPRSRTPLPFGKASSLKRKLSGEIVRRNP